MELETRQYQKHARQQEEIDEGMNENPAGK
jgi:hypothetical protein